MSRQRIFVIEDDQWQAEQSKRILQSAGYEVSCFADGIAAIEAVDRQLPDAIVLDMLLAGTTALTLVHELQSYGDTGQIPIVLCTNIAEQVRLEDVKPYGVGRILDKTTMQPGDLITALRSLLP